MPKKSLYEQIASIVFQLESLCKENNVNVNVYMDSDVYKTEINFHLED